MGCLYREGGSGQVNGQAGRRAGRQVSSPAGAGPTFTFTFAFTVCLVTRPVRGTLTPLS